MSVIAISRGSLAAVEKLAAGLGKRTGSRVVSREQVIDAAKRYGIDKTGISRENIAGETPPGFWDRYSEARHHYLTCFKAALFDFAVKEPIIYHGNLAHVLLNDVPFVLRVRVNAPREDRVKMLMEEKGSTRERAVAEVRERDKRRRRWIHFLYESDSVDPIFFDLVFNMQKVTVDDAIEMISSEIRNPAFRRTEESVRKLFDLRLAAVAETHLLHSPETYGPGLEVAANSTAGEVTAFKDPTLGHDASVDDEIRAALAGVEGVRKVIFQSPAAGHIDR